MKRTLAILGTFFGAMAVVLWCMPERDEVPQDTAPRRVAKSKPRIRYEFRKVTETSGATSYIFEADKKPRLNLGGSAALLDVVGINEALASIGLPPVDQTVQQLSSITGFRVDRAHYYWEDYPAGELTVQRTSCRSGGDSYDCVWKVTLETRGPNQ